jgi:hypothetical protein
MSIKIEHTQVFGWEGAIRGARNPMNSWAKSDSVFKHGDDYWGIDGKYTEEQRNLVCNAIAKGQLDDSCVIGPNDYKLLMNLCKGGSEEAKWRRMIHVQTNVTAPLYWWKEFETYKVGTVSNSCSTMHKIHSKEFTLEDFSCEHLISDDIKCYENDECFIYPFTDCPDGDGEMETYPLYMLKATIKMLNKARECFLNNKDKNSRLAKCYWWQMIQLLPSSYNQRRTIDLNYEVLATQYRQRKEHKLDEWREYCEWIKTLPYSEFITMKEE